MAGSTATETNYCRLIQISVSKDTHVLLAKLMLSRTEQDHPPSKVTKSALIAEAIAKLALAEGIQTAGGTDGSQP